MEMIVLGGGVLPLCLLLLFLAVQHGLQDLSSLTRDGIGAHGSRKQQVLTTGPPGNSQKWQFYKYRHLKSELGRRPKSKQRKDPRLFSLYTEESQPESDKPCFKSRLYHSLVDWVLDKLLNFWSLSFLIFKNSHGHWLHTTNLQRLQADKWSPSDTELYILCALRVFSFPPSLTCFFTPKMG